MIRWALLPMLLCAHAAMAQGGPIVFAGPPDLYAATAYVTGTRAETRQDGILISLRRVLAKVSGNPALLDDPAVAIFDPLAAGMVEDIAYLDRMSDEPHHDEQGTRDRPFDLTVHFDAARINALLLLLGDRPWLGQRPRILTRIDIDDHGARFPLAADTESDERQREALLSAAERSGLRVVLAPAEGAQPILAPRPITLSGSLVWDDNAAGWVGHWHLEGNGPARDWSISGVSFDEAFRNAMQGSLASITGHWSAMPASR